TRSASPDCRPGESRGPYSSGLCLWVPAFAGTTGKHRVVQNNLTHRTTFLTRSAISVKRPHVKEVNDVRRSQGGQSIGSGNGAGRVPAGAPGRIAAWFLIHDVQQRTPPR